MRAGDTFILQLRSYEEHIDADLRSAPDQPRPETHCEFADSMRTTFSEMSGASYSANISTLLHTTHKVAERGRVCHLWVTAVELDAQLRLRSLATFQRKTLRAFLHFSTSNWLRTEFS